MSEKDKKDIKKEKETEIKKPLVEQVGESGEELEEDGSNVATLPMIPLRGLTIFPNMVLHFDIGREKSINALEKAMILNKHIFLVTQKDENTDLPTPEDFYHVGTVAKIKQMLKLPGDNIRVLVEGLYRGEIRDVLFEVPYFRCAVNTLPDLDDEDDAKTEALRRLAVNSFDDYLALKPNGQRDLLPVIMSIKEPGRAADMMASHLDIKIEDKQLVLEAFDVAKRLELIHQFLSREIEILNIEQDLNSKVKSQIDKNQKEYYLREQMRAIQDELGMDEDVESEMDDWFQQLKKLKLSKKTHEKVEKEIKRFGKMMPSSAEASVSRTYIETILALPWNKASKSKLDLIKAEEILNNDHYGLEKVKERVLEYLAVIQLSKGLKGPILCLVGPPGVGKTSVARSVARAINREFVRMSLGGVRDEAEIRGHRRTYIGAIPGRVISSIKDAGTNNPVFLFDEVDKIGMDFKGDPASALLEVLDPEQNKEFTDHYLEVPFDLSKVMFITTANTTDTIPRPLLDRMEVLEVPGYTEEEKVKIAQNYLIPKKVKEHGLKEEEFCLSEQAVRDLINYYTRESGVRNLEREIANLCRKIARKIVTEGEACYDITPDKLEAYLGKRKYRYDIIQGEEEVGVVTGLAWTIVGGDTLFIETSAVPGTGKLELTGQMGDVMQESAKAGISYIRNRANEMGIPEDFYKTLDLHIHIPEGAVPKDGPSAGVTMCTAMISTLTGGAVKKDVAMTGEITLRGKVLPVGGIREKVLAAHRAGIKKVLLPRENEKDLEDIPEVVRKEMAFVLIETVDEALEHAMVKRPKPKKTTKAAQPKTVGKKKMS
jgi:ATP-dependent Lon protease